MSPATRRASTAFAPAEPRARPPAPRAPPVTAATRFPRRRARSTGSPCAWRDRATRWASSKRRSTEDRRTREMQMNTRQLLRRALRTGLAAAIMLAADVVGAAQTDIASQPLAQPASNVPPNIMMILDDSGSMIQQYTPDYLGRHYGGSNALCLGSKDSSGTI